MDVLVAFIGMGARVFLLDRFNLALYRGGRRFKKAAGGSYEGGDPNEVQEVHLRVPFPGQWHVVVDSGGLPGLASATFGTVRKQ